MFRRLVYAPYVQAFIKSDHGVIDISPYITSGSVNRRINQVSSAQLTLRNPVKSGTDRLLWTEHEYTDMHGNHTIGPMFHPMDPIIVSMTRLPGYPIQLFTGYVDTSPYLQLFPGLCTIEASCTLKRLLYTQWDAALPFVQYFLEQFGWQLNGDSGLINPNAETKKVQGYRGQLKGAFNDGSIGALLFAVLNVFGHWDESIIWIEALPPEIKNIVVKLYHDIQTEVAQGDLLFEGLLSQILGSGSQGSGSPGGVGSTGGGSLTGPVTVKGQSPTVPQKALIEQVMSIATRLRAPTRAVEALLEACIQENSFTNNAGGGGGSNGLLQLLPSTAAGLGISPFDVNACVTDFLKVGFYGQGGAIALANNNPQLSAHEIAQDVQGSGAGSADGGASTYGQWLNEADKIINAYSSATSASQNSPGTASSLAPSNGHKRSLSMPVVKSGRSPGGKTQDPNPSSTTPYFPLAAGTYVSNSNWKPDDGIDISTKGAGCGAKAPLLAIGDGTIVGHGIPGFGPSAPILQLDAPLSVNGNTYQYVYYGHAGPGGLTPLNAHVSAGNPIGQVGCGIVGISTGPHLEIGFCNASGNPLGPSTASDMLSVLSSAQSGQPIGTATGGSGGTGSGAGSGGGTGTGDASTAAAFSTFINLPSIFDSAEALAFTGKRSFMADQPLFPFIEQLCQASLRHFMSMPNGNFFAFFADYFGLFGRKAYWEIHDIEIIDCRIDLSDDPLVTHVAVAGDVTQFHGTIDVFDKLQTSGIFTIFDAMATGYVADTPDPRLDFFGKAKVNTSPKSKANNKAARSGKEAGLAFLQRYGARPYVEEAPMIRSPFFELFLAFQKFMLLWSKQFQTTIELTFMPELFPGGLIELHDHHLQLYVEEVVHNFDYVGGFTTTVNVSSPASLDGSRPDLARGMARPEVLATSTPANTHQTTLLPKHMQGFGPA